MLLISRNIKVKFLTISILILVCITSLSEAERFSKATEHSQTETISSDAESFEDIKVLAILGNYFGDAYFWVKTQLEEWGVNVSVAGMTPIVQSCSHKPPRPVTSDVLISEVDEGILAQFDCVYVPAGGHWESLFYSTSTKNLISTAYEMGLVIASICIGNKVVAVSNGIVNGVKVAYYSGCALEMNDAGAIHVYSTAVVSDKRIITAGTGLCGTIHCNIYTFSVSITKACLGQTSVVSASIVEYERVTAGENYGLIVTTNNLSDIYYGNLSSDITAVYAYVYWEDAPDDGIDLTLNDDAQENIFIANFSSIEDGKYHIDLEVKSFAWGMEVVRDATSFQIGVPGFTIGLTILALISISIVVIKKRRK
ncbi:MAG: DJ-1/PfpI family protein [Candidatus Heimdallarchaeota archaeon]